MKPILYLAKYRLIFVTCEPGFRMKIQKRSNDAFCGRGFERCLLIPSSPIAWHCLFTIASKRNVTRITKPELEIIAYVASNKIFFLMLSTS